FNAIHRLVYSGALARPDLAALSTLVYEAAVAGDRVAQRLLQEAGEELGRLAVGVVHALKMQKEYLTVGTVGGVFRAGAWVVDPFTRVVKEEAPFARIVPRSEERRVGKECRSRGGPRS